MRTAIFLSHRLTRSVRTTAGGCVGRCGDIDGVVRRVASATRAARGPVGTLVERSGFGVDRRKRPSAAMRVGRHHVPLVGERPRRPAEQPLWPPELGFVDRLAIQPAALRTSHVERRTCTAATTRAIAREIQHAVRRPARLVNGFVRSAGNKLQVSRACRWRLSAATHSSVPSHGICGWRHDSQRAAIRRGSSAAWSRSRSPTR